MYSVQKDKLVPLNKSSTRQIVNYIISFAEVEKYEASQNAIFCTCLVDITTMISTLAPLCPGQGVRGGRRAGGYRDPAGRLRVARRGRGQHGQQVRRRPDRGGGLRRRLQQRLPG